MTPAQRLRRVAGRLAFLKPNEVAMTIAELLMIADEVDEEKKAIAEEKLHDSIVNSIDPYGQEGF